MANKTTEERKLKSCTICKKVKPVDEFYKQSSPRTDYLSDCKSCRNVKSKRKRKELSVDEREILRIRIRKYQDKHRELYRSRSKKWSEDNPERSRKAISDWKKANPKRVAETRRLWNNKRNSTPKGNLSHRMSSLVRYSLVTGKHGSKWESLVGYTVKQLKNHIENLFTKDMTWEKFLSGAIHIDHIIPISFFKYNSPDDVEFRMCWRLDNLQPLYAADNMRKGNKIKVVA